MILPTLQHGCTTGRHLWLCISVTLGLALGSQAAAARECHRETPLPADVRLVAPGPEVSEAAARFAGAWIGAWLDNENEALCHTLVVEEVLASSYARVIYSVGTYADWNARLPNFWRATGWIIQGQLHFQLPVPGGPELAYRFAGETLSGTFKGEGRVSLTRVADLSQVGCGSQASRLPPAPPAAGPREHLTAALYKTEAIGLPSGMSSPFGEGRYHLSFWAVPHRTRGGCSFQIPYMAGLGGNLVVLLPNGITAFRFSDGHSCDMDPMVLAAEAIRPFPCPVKSGEAPQRSR